MGTCKSMCQLNEKSNKNKVPTKSLDLKSIFNSIKNDMKILKHEILHDIIEFKSFIYTLKSYEFLRK